MKAASSTQQAPNTTARKQATEAITVRCRSYRYAGLGRAIELGLLAEARAQDGAGVGGRKIHDQRRHARGGDEIAGQPAAPQPAIGAPGHAEQHRQHAQQPDPQQEAEEADQMAMADDRHDQGNDADGQRRKDELLAERHRRRELGLARPVGVPDLRHQLARDLHEALRPAALLGAEILQPLRQLADHVRLHQEHPAPALEMGAQHEVEILRQRVVRPAARLFHRGAAPDAAGAVELERHAAPRPDVLLDGEVGVLHQPLRARQPVALAVAPFDAGLHERRARAGQHRGHRAPQPVGRRHEVGVEHRDIGRVAQRHAGRQGAGLEAAAVGPPDMLGVDAFLAQAGDGVERRCRR